VPRVPREIEAFRLAQQDHRSDAERALHLAIDELVRDARTPAPPSAVASCPDTPKGAAPNGGALLKGPPMAPPFARVRAGPSQLEDLS
jgi:hypothetical protein